MDLELRGGGALRAPFLNRYLELTRDGELSSCCHSTNLTERWCAAKSRRFVPKRQRRWRPATFDMGHSSHGGGQTIRRDCLRSDGKREVYAAGELAERLGMPVINSDGVRKEIADSSAET